MASDWIIVGAVIVLVAGVVLFFKTSTDDVAGPKSGRTSGDKRTKRVSHGR